MSNQNVNAASSGKFSSLFASILIPVALVIGYLIFTFVLGNPGNFEGNDPTKHPHPGNLLGMMYKGGILVPILMANFIIVICVIIERFITLNVASGKGSIPNFVRKVKGLLDSNNVDAAITECDKQKGSVANVIREGLHKYKEMGSKSGLDKEQKVLAIQKK